MKLFLEPFIFVFSSLNCSKYDIYVYENLVVGLTWFGNTNNPMRVLLGLYVLYT